MDNMKNLPLTRIETIPSLSLISNNELALKDPDEHQNRAICALRGFFGVLSLVLGGCASPILVLETDGLSKDIGTLKATGQYQVFATAFTRAQAAANTSANSGAVATATDLASYERMAREGMSTIEGNCSDFFTVAGEHEKWISFSRDAVAVGGSLLSGILALSSAGSTAIAITTLSTTTIYSGLDTYSKNFLFGAENIDNVRTLILGALDTHRNAVLADSSPWSFGSAMMVVLDHQDICRPSSIVNLVRSAIKNGTIVALSPTTASDAAATADKALEVSISSAVGNAANTVIDASQLAALYWLYITNATSAQSPSIVATLKTLPAGPYNSNGTVNASFAAKKASVTDLLGRLSAGAKSTINQQIATWEAQIAATPPHVGPVAPGAPAVAPVVAPLVAAPSPPGASVQPGGKHIGVRVVQTR